MIPQMAALLASAQHADDAETVRVPLRSASDGSGQKRFRSVLHRYVRNSRFLVFVTAPFIWMCFFPLALMDLVVSVYQLVCFPIYGIPKVSRRDYLAFDRHKLDYLNAIEKVNCEYCAYANGILGYFTEIAARTEQHWCPIKHEIPLLGPHNRYQAFLDFGDAENYRANIETIRRDYRDLATPLRVLPASTATSKAPASTDPIIPRAA